MPPAADEPLWTMRDVATLLRCDRKTVARKVHAEGLPAVRTGNRCLFRPAAVRAWIEGRERAISPPPGPAARATRHRAPAAFPVGLSACAEALAHIKGLRR